MTPPIDVDEIREALKGINGLNPSNEDLRTILNAAPQLLARLELLETVRRDAEAYVQKVQDHGMCCWADELAALRKSLAAVEVTNG